MGSWTEKYSLLRMQKGQDDKKDKVKQTRWGIEMADWEADGDKAYPG